MLVRNIVDWLFFRSIKPRGATS